MRPVCTDCRLQPLRSSRVRRTRRDDPAPRGREAVPHCSPDVVHVVVVRAALGFAMHEVARVSVVELNHGCVPVGVIVRLPIALLTVMPPPSRPLGRRPCRGLRPFRAPFARDHRRRIRSRWDDPASARSRPRSRRRPAEHAGGGAPSRVQPCPARSATPCRRDASPSSSRPQHGPREVRPHLSPSLCRFVIATRSTCPRPGHRQLQDMQSSGVALAIRLATAGNPKVFTASLPAQARNPIAALPTTSASHCHLPDFSVPPPHPNHPFAMRAKRKGRPRTPFQGVPAVAEVAHADTSPLRRAKHGCEPDGESVVVEDRR